MGDSVYGNGAGKRINPPFHSAKLPQCEPCPPTLAAAGLVWFCKQTSKNKKRAWRILLPGLVPPASRLVWPSVQNNVNLKTFLGHCINSKIHGFSSQVEIKYLKNLGAEPMSSTVDLLSFRMFQTGSIISSCFMQNQTLSPPKSVLSVQTGSSFPGSFQAMALHITCQLLIVDARDWNGTSPSACKGGALPLG